MFGVRKPLARYGRHVGRARSRLADSERPAGIRDVIPLIIRYDPQRRGKSGSQVADISSESCPASHRNAVRLRVGMRDRLQIVRVSGFVGICTGSLCNGETTMLCGLFVVRPR